LLGAPVFGEVAAEGCGEDRLAALESEDDERPCLPGHPMNDQRLSSELEIILNQESGGIVRMGVFKSSGITVFDVAALESVKRAAPFGAPPPEIVSPDGNVYVHWKFHRNSEACSTFNARPFLLKAPPKAAAD
jgi:TonB family protein